MRVKFPGIAVVALAITWGVPAIAARVFPSRNPLFLNEEQTVLLTKPDDAKRSSRIVGAGEVRLSNGDVLSFGRAPKF